MSQSDEAVAVVPAAPARKSAKVEKVPLHNPDPAFCSYYVTRKHRFCRTECKPGSLYCCTHDSGISAQSSGTKEGAVAVGSSSTKSEGTDGPAPSGGARVPCPINPNHTVYASRLEKHVKVCPDLRFVATQLPYFRENKHANKGAIFVSSSRCLDAGEATARRTHRDLAPDGLAALICKVADCYRTCVAPEIVVMPSCDTGVTTTMAEPKLDSASSSAVSPSLSGPTTTPLSHAESTSQKHGPQHTALLRCLNDVVLQFREADSIVAQYTHLPHHAREPAADASAPIHVDGFVEFGAGKGGLSVALQQLLVQHLPTSESKREAAKADHAARDAARAPLSASPPAWPFLDHVAPHPPLVVLDMDGFRRKGDARVRHSAMPLRRLRINIKDVDLTQAFVEGILPTCTPADKAAKDATEVSAVETRSGSSVAVGEDKVQNWAMLGKHLCGACTDFALSCLTEAPSLAQEARVQLPVVVIATCCHHRCELRHLNPPTAVLSDYAEARVTGGEGEPAVLVMPGAAAFTWTEDEFAALTSMSSWAVCGGFVDEGKRLVGRQCKRIIDQLRVHFLRQLGYVAFQCQYTTRDITEENVCIVGFQPSRSS
jgi:tRNA:m4X modification enzyme